MEVGIVMVTNQHSSPSVFFEHYIMLWKHPSVGIRVHTLSGAVKRILAGLSVCFFALCKMYVY